MKRKSILPRHPNGLKTDFKAEVVAAALLQFYDSAQSVYIKRLGNRGRAKKKDIARIWEDHMSLTPCDIVIEVNREGIYDYMPEGVFHKPTLGKIKHGTEAVIAAIREQRRQENDNRLFFSPFEQETFLQEIFALSIEQRIDNKGLHDNLLQLIYPLWPLLEQLDTATAKIFIYLLPFFYMASGNKKWFTKILQSLLGYPITITEVPHLMKIDRHHPEIDFRIKRLGISTVLTGDHFDGNTNWQLTIGPVDAKDATAFLPNSKMNQLLLAIYENFAPEETEIKQKLSIRHKPFRLSNRKNEWSGHLGYTTFI
ncbi:type VI secretion system baseplate subunit TssG [Taibaiella soli]|uniref:Type VI secretion system baseplate subunit TssG n=1 Tax=Taibaiella soli TaxID=1649169 RepID=A0A2W2BGY9_9BACT|nr:type VI secretion system baseplate subunit TssG [Taibaiella soli]PZF72746.1 hypothetical protein DN068_12870 [Taibaiella soli]